MPKPGPKPKVSDERLLAEVLMIESKAVFASQITDRVNMTTVQGVRDRLNRLVDKDGYLARKEVSGRNMYSLTDDGREYIQEIIRDRLD